jgi:molybdopterin-containing oxidoreductase family membrane subunit
MFPIPNQMSMWPQFRSPLEWDVFAVGTYFTVSLLFWYMGMIPDFGTFRDRATTPARRFVFGFLAMGWRGSSRHWHRYERAYLLLAALATPLVLSVHSVVSFDFARSAPGWRDDLPALLRQWHHLSGLRWWSPPVPTPVLRAEAAHRDPAPER